MASADMGARFVGVWVAGWGCAQVCGYAGRSGWVGCRYASPCPSEAFTAGHPYHQGPHLPNLPPRHPVPTQQ
jgi:hypothetical protein